MLGSSLAQFFTQIAVGQGWLATILMTATISVLTFAARGQTGVAAALVLALVALVPLALQGHAAGAGNHVAATVALWLHVAGAAVWVGGLAAVTYAAAFDERAFVPLVRRFSAIAFAGLCAVTISGMAGALVRLSHPVQLLTTDYGRLLSLKIVALLLLVGFGWAQRTWVIRRFGSTDMPALRRRLVFGSLVLWELLVLGVAMGAGATLSRTETPGGQILLATKAEQLTGDRIPPAPGIARLVDTWVFDAAAVLVVLLGLGSYLYGVFAAQRNGGWPRSRTLAGVGAAVVIVFAFCSLPGRMQRSRSRRTRHCLC
ncbi:copper resistance D family protein [Leifsonia sp. L25]|uniref:copper resistance D family protein n=1 Tax=Leifsonia sp. L25 TaxID=3423957 RepID=UPI003D69AC86